VLFWVITQRVVIIHYRGFGTTYQAILMVQESKRKPVAPIRSLYREERGVIYYRRFGTTYQPHPHGSRIQEKACSPNKEFI
jgi:hypothetical protein